MIFDTKNRISPRLDSLEIEKKQHVIPTSSAQPQHDQSGQHGTKEIIQNINELISDLHEILQGLEIELEYILVPAMEQEIPEFKDDIPSKLMQELCIIQNRLLLLVQHGNDIKNRVQL